MTDIGQPTPEFNAAAVREVYARERARRITAARAATADILHDERFAKYRSDPFTEFTERDPIADEVDVVIVGAGMAGIVLGAKLRESGVQRVRLIDTAGGFGGTWYWNRYPGLMCDVEAYIYLPMLEEMGYMPTSRYAAGSEIRQHLESIADKYRLEDEALFHTTITSSEWSEDESRWIVRTDRGDTVRSSYLVLAPGMLNLLKMPVIEGLEDFEGGAFHSGRWRYDLTGGTDTEPVMSKLSGKNVGVIGIGGSAIQAIPQLAKYADQVFAFQRTPSAIGVRNNQATDAEFVASLKPGWQKERMTNFSVVMSGADADVNMVDDAWTHHMGNLVRIGKAAKTDEDLAELEAFDFEVMEEHRRRVDAEVKDPAVAKSLKPYYRYLCKRPLFHDGYLAAFNEGSLTLVDCPTGVERITPRGVVANGTEYELDFIVFATGYEAESTPLARRVGHEIRGVGGITLQSKWADGPTSLHGLATSGFPNMFIMPTPGQQAVTTVNYAHVMLIGADHISASIAALKQAGISEFEVTPEAESAWTELIVSGYRDNRDFMASCTPSRMNFDSNPDGANPRNGTYGGGYGDVLGYIALLEEWRSNGQFEGWALRAPESTG